METQFQSPNPLGSHVLAVVHWSPVLAVQVSRLSCPGCPVTAVLTQLYCSDCPVQEVWS
jgi:hypothetical protein